MFRIPKSFVTKVTQSRAQNVRGIFATDETGKNAYYFLLIAPIKLDAFEEALTVGSLELTDFGEIITSGYGEIPEHVKEAMMIDYGFSADD